MKKFFCPKALAMVWANQSQKGGLHPKDLFWRCTHCGEKHS